MFAELLDGAKKDILAQVQESIEQVRADFEYKYLDDPKGDESGTVSSPAAKIDDFLQPKASNHGAEGENSDFFKSLAEYSVAEKTSPAIDVNLQT